MAANDWVRKELKIASSPYREFNRQNNPDAYDAVEGTDAAEPVGADPIEVMEQLELPLDLVNRLRNEMKIAGYNMWPNLKGIGVDIPDPDDTGTSDDYYGKPSDNPDMPEGWQLSGLADNLRIDPTGHKAAQKKTKIYNKATQGSGTEKDWLKRTGPQLPLDLVQINPAALEALKAGTKKGLSSQEIRNLLKPFTKPDQFGHPSGSMKIL